MLYFFWFSKILCFFCGVSMSSASSVVVKVLWSFVFSCSSSLIAVLWFLQVFSVVWFQIKLAVLQAQPFFKVAFWQPKIIKWLPDIKCWSPEKRDSLCVLTGCVSVDEVSCSTCLPTKCLHIQVQYMTRVLFICLINFMVHSESVVTNHRHFQSFCIVALVFLFSYESHRK